MLWRPRNRRPELDFIVPCQPSRAERAPSGTGWVHEIKHDGYRIMARRRGGQVRLLTRGGHDWADRFPLIVQAVGALASESCTIDGEAVACDERALAVFDLLRSHGPRRVLLYAFDLIELDGEDLRGHPLELRKRALKRLLRKSARPGLQFNEYLEEAGPLVFEHACRLGCEGIVSKRLGSRYESGPTRSWLKIKNPAAPAATRVLEGDWSRPRRGK
jgi:bifunctional non-homologous end joining protein LigD